MGAAWPPQALDATPAYLEAGGVPVLSWWHLPRQEPAGMPVLMCPAWGDEGIGAYRGWRDLAQALADGGHPVLRIEWPGDGDAFDAAPSAASGGLCGPWRQALAQAIDALKLRCGTQTVALLGLRLGGLLAAHEAAGRSDVAALLLLAPPASGRTLLRELRLLATPHATQGLAEGEVPAGGLVLDAHTAAHLQQLAWPTSGQGPPTWLLDRSDRPWPDAAMAALGQWAAPLAHLPRSDLSDLTSVAHAAHWPPDLADALRQALAAAAPRPARQAAAPEPQALEAAALAFSPQARAAAAPLPATRPDAAWLEQAQGAGVRERPVAYAPGRWGVLSEPAGDESARPQRAVLLLSSGAERRVGPHRLWVDLARERARRGELALRIDLSGMGDSLGHGLPSADAIYDPACLDDVAAAVAWLREAQGVRELSLVGLCSGAHHAWRAALQGLPVQTVLPINPLVFHWRPGMSIEPARLAFGQLGISANAGRSLRDPARWLKLLRGQVNVRIILQAVWGRARLVARSRSRAAARVLGWPLKDDLAQELQTLARRGLMVKFVFSAEDPGLKLLAQEAGATWARLLRDGRVHLHTIDDADHTFSTVAARGRLYRCLHSLLDPVVSTGASDAPI